MIQMEKIGSNDQNEIEKIAGNVTSTRSHVPRLIGGRWCSSTETFNKMCNNTLQDTGYPLSHHHSQALNEAPMFETTASSPSD